MPVLPEAPLPEVSPADVARAIEPSPAVRTLALLRRFLLGLVALGAVGLIAELALMEHWDQWTQWIPFVLLVATLITTTTLLLRGGRRALRAFRVVMVLSVVSGAVGSVLHYRGNAALEREIAPDLAPPAVFWAALEGATPILAPGAMIQLGLMGLLAAFRDPISRG